MDRPSLKSLRDLDFLLNHHPKRESMFGPGSTWNLPLSEETKKQMDFKTAASKSRKWIAVVLEQMGYENVETTPRDSRVQFTNYAYEPSTNTHFVVVDPAYMQDGSTLSTNAAL